MFTLGYFIESQLCVVVLYLFYIAFLHNRIANKVSRAYLLTMLPVALIVPLVNLPILPAPIVQMYDADIDMVQTLEVATTTVADMSSLLWGYIAGVVVMLMWLVVGIIMLVVQLHKSLFESRNGMKIVFTNRKMSAYSVFNYVFVNAEFRGSEYLDSLLVHEECHIRQRHTIDLIYMSLLRAALWFNPAVWHIGALLRQVHEYQADEEVINKGYSTQNYINLLILSEAGISPEFASHLSYSLTKKRLTMLAKKQRVTSLRRLLLALPVIAMLLIAFSVTTRAAIILPATDPAPTKKEKPLILVNGVEWKKSMDDINPATIANISVTKNKEDIKKYGAKGKDGVILITLHDGDTSKQPKTLTVNTGGKKTVKIYSDSENNDGNSREVNKAVTILNGKVVDIRSINPDNIAKMDVLKGEAATKVYGDTGKDGVNLITLRDGDTSKHPKIVTVNTEGNKRVNVIVRSDSENNDDNSRRVNKAVTIIDGKVVNIKSINLNNIAKMEVLKGEAAIKAYGDMGKDGVVIITLKDGATANSPQGAEPNK